MNAITNEDRDGGPGGEPTAADLASIEAALNPDEQDRVVEYWGRQIRDAYRSVAADLRAAKARQDEVLFGARPERRAVRRANRSVVLRVLPGGGESVPSGAGRGECGAEVA